MSQTPASAPILESETLKAIDLCLEAFYEDSMKAGNEMASADLSRAQIRGLETLITSATRFSEILNYIKNQVGKDKKGKWQRIGSLLLDQLEALEKKANEMGKDVPGVILDIKLRLARGWARQVVTHCLFSMSRK